MNLSYLHKKYNTQEKCITHLEKLRWGKYRYCIFCDAENVTKRKNSIKWHCNNCNRDYSVLMDTIFEQTRLPLPQYFEIILLMNNAKMGISASEIARNVGVKYQTAWYACHRIRCAMINEELRLEGMIEFDEAYIGGKRKNKYKEFDPSEANQSVITSKRGRGTNKTSIVGAVEKKGKVYVKIIEKLSGRNLLAMLKQVVNIKDSIIFTDGFRSYNAFDEYAEHIVINHSESYGHGIRTINTIEGFWSIIKNGIKGSYRAISKKYLPFYLAEYSYKYNNRHLQKNAFENLLVNAVRNDNEFTNYKPKRNPKSIVYGKRRSA